jgi:glycosyltransferase involved in cell wall biosynthesis
MRQPTVSMVMPTWNRSKYVPMAIRCFTQQVYSVAELIIVDDGAEQLALPADARIRYIKLDNRTSTGTKRNIGAEAARGDIIASLDDDDYSSPHRIQDEIQRLLKTGKAVTGYNRSVMFEEATGKFFKTAGGPPYFASGSSQCYMKTWWDLHPFPDITMGEDTEFSRVARQADELAIADPGKMLVVRRHANNTYEMNLERQPEVSPHSICGEFFKAQVGLSPTLEYMWQAHECNTACLADAYRQFLEPMVEYKMGQS